jgi:GNAT superfamily N-acetyltransferase
MSGGSGGYGDRVPTLGGLLFELSGGPADAAEVARLRTADDPDTPVLPAEIEWYWRRDQIDSRVFERWLGRDDHERVMAYASFQHRAWRAGVERWASVGVLAHPEVLAADLWSHLYDFLGSRVRGAQHLRSEILETREERIRLLEGLGWRRDRVGRRWELDLVEGHQRLTALAEAGRDRMAEAGITLTTWDRADRPGLLEAAHAVSSEGDLDVPSSEPAEASSLAAFRAWLDSEGIHRDRLWLAFDADGVVGISVLKYGEVVWTDWTCSARRARGRGVARALKLETVLQARQLGFRLVRTENDGENAPILYLNAQLGYRAIPGIQAMVLDL